MRSPELIAVTRFGLGPRPGEVAAASSDPRGFVLSQLNDPHAAEIDAPGLRSHDEVREAYVRLQRGAQKTWRAMREDASKENREANNAARRARGEFAAETLLAEIGARYQQGVATRHPFLERLVLFWSNHFAIDAGAQVVLRFAGSLFEREAIRPHVLGSFEDMLRAATTHPGMLVYLDNHRSIGPNSRASRRARHRRLDVNENLARELLELHTLGVDGGYTQGDVEETALVLSGWAGGFTTRRHNAPFEMRYHEPGFRTVLGTTYPAGGREQLLSLLSDLAHHPATARHVSQKLARHFCGSAAPRPLVAALEATYNDTGGDLRALARTLASHEAAWTHAPAKSVPPYDFMVAAGRAVGLHALDGRLVRRASRALAHEVWRAPSPAGWPDEDDAFMGGDAFMERIDFARLVARRFGVRDVRGLADALFAHTLDPEVKLAVRRAESAQQALVLLLMAPALHRR